MNYTSIARLLYIHWGLWSESRNEKSSSFQTSGTPGKHQWLQSGTDGLSLQDPTCASLLNAPMGVTCNTVTGIDVFLATSIMTSENGCLSLPLTFDLGCCVTLQFCRDALQWVDSNVRKNTRVLLVLILLSTQDFQVASAVLKALEIGIPSFIFPPIWKYQPLYVKELSRCPPMPWIEDKNIRINPFFAYIFWPIQLKCYFYLLWSSFWCLVRLH